MRVIIGLIKANADILSPMAKKISPFQRPLTISMPFAKAGQRVATAGQPISAFEHNLITKFITVTKSAIAVLLITAPVWVTAPAQAITIPKQLTKDDRVEVVKTLGLTTSTKLLTNPFPLGGYSGFEVGLSLEIIDVREMNHLGAGSADGDLELRHPRLTVGKGLYNNFDLFLHFSPMTSGSEMTGFGGALRHSFYEARFLPVNMSIVGHADHVNINNDFENVSLGADVVAGIYVNHFSLYFGFGQIRSTGTFTGGTGTDGTVDLGDPDLSSATNTISHTVTKNHSYLGATLHFNQLFAAAQIDRYPDTTYSGRIGMRF